MLTVSLSKRDFSSPLSVPVSWQVEELAWSAIGGPDTARLVAFGDQAALWELVELLRCPLQITDDRAETVWHGYVDSVQVGGAAAPPPLQRETPSIGAGFQALPPLPSGEGGGEGSLSSSLMYGVGLSSMANAIQVAYADALLVGSLGDLVGERQNTTWLEDAESIATYGRKELRLSLPLASLAQAEAYRLTALTQRKYPVPSLTFSHSRPSSPSLTDNCILATVNCLGWWHTLDWLYYAQPAGIEENPIGGMQDWIGAQVADSKYGQTFQIGSSISYQAQKVRLHAKTIGAPADSLRLQICAASGGNPGAVYHTVDIPGPSLGISSPMQLVEFTITPPLNLNPGVVYWLVVSRTGAADGWNYYMVDTFQGSSVYPRGELFVHDGASWAPHNPAGDLWFQIVGVLETTLQLNNMLYAQSFLPAWDVETASGVLSSIYRAGDDRLRTEIEAILSTGTSTGRRYLASVSPSRRVTIYQAPLPGSADYGLSSSGELTDPAGRPVPPWWGVVGVWARLRDVIPASADLSRLANPARFFIEGARWSQEGGRLTLSVEE